MDLIEFLRARLDEDEELARAATQGPWMVEDQDSSGGYQILTEDDGVAIQGHYGGGVPWAHDASHIARHDPARVLKEVEVKRRVLNLHRPDRYEGCTVCHPDSCGCVGGGLFPCDTVQLLALPYSDHPDYRDEWRP